MTVPGILRALEEANLYRDALTWAQTDADISAVDGLDVPIVAGLLRKRAGAGHPASALVVTPTGRRAESVAAVASAAAEGQPPMLQLRWLKRGEMLVGQAGACQLLVKNNGQATAVDVVVEAFFPSTVRLITTLSRNRERDIKCGVAFRISRPSGVS